MPQRKRPSDRIEPAFYNPPMARTFPVILLPQPEGGYFAQCSTLQGCYSQGETVEEALENIREAIELVLEDMAARGETVPQSGPPIITEVTVAA